MSPAPQLSERGSLGPRGDSFIKTLTAKYPGTCFHCHKPIRLGDVINFHGKGKAAHPVCDATAPKNAPSHVPDSFDMQVEDNMRDACGL